MIVLLNKLWLTIERHILLYQIAVTLKHRRVLHHTLNNLQSPLHASRHVIDTSLRCHELAASPCVQGELFHRTISTANFMELIQALPQGHPSSSYGTFHLVKGSHWIAFLHGQKLDTLPIHSPGENFISYRIAKFDHQNRLAEV
jgi:hypothetical protein